MQVVDKGGGRAESWEERELKSAAAPTLPHPRRRPGHAPPTGRTQVLLELEVVLVVDDGGADSVQEARVVGHNHRGHLRRGRGGGGGAAAVSTPQPTFLARIEKQAAARARAQAAPPQQRNPLCTIAQQWARRAARTHPLQAGQVADQPGHIGGVQMVGGLIQQHDVGVHEHGAGQSQLHLPATCGEWWGCGGGRVTVCAPGWHSGRASPRVLEDQKPAPAALPRSPAHAPDREATGEAWRAASKPTDSSTSMMRSRAGITSLTMSSFTTNSTTGVSASAGEEGGGRRQGGLGCEQGLGVRGAEWCRHAAAASRRESHSTGRRWCNRGGLAHQTRQCRAPHTRCAARSWGGSRPAGRWLQARGGERGEMEGRERHGAANAGV